MKNILSATLLLAFGSASYSQDAVLEKMAIQSCDCLHAKKIDYEASSEKELETVFASCVIQSFATHQVEYSKFAKVNFGDQSAMEKLGVDIAVKMMAHCPEVIMAMGASDDDEDSTATVSQTIDGQLTEILTGEFVSFKVKDANGRMHTFILLDYFDTASLFTENQLKQKDKVSVSYTEIELYDPKMKEFRYYKVIDGLQKI